jgi:hypothetical protein
VVITTKPLPRNATGKVNRTQVIVADRPHRSVI